jgi:probable H4MPT-linked C1 transfer pathway protein
MRAEAVLGWDIGGAHLKVAAVNGSGKVMRVRSLPCTLWLGLEHLDRAISAALAGMPASRLHAVTMTGELTDLFRNRGEGVRSIIAFFTRQVPAERVRIYAGPSGFLTPQRAIRQSAAVASANWAASAELVASRLPDALFVDVGSTTTDIVPIRAGQLMTRALTDADRLAWEELVYSGVVRTPVMALAQRIAFEGQLIPAMAEYFATTADIYRLTGELPRGADQLPAADNKGKRVRDSARRLARMIGRDLDPASLVKWKRCARDLAQLQLAQIQQACERARARIDNRDGPPMVGAGTGRFLVKKIAKRLGMPYRDFNTLVHAARGAAAQASSCAPAVAVALLVFERTAR